LHDGPGVLRVEPSAVMIQPVAKGTPEAFRKRRTIRLLFDKKAMSAVPGGLYDVRLEVQKGGALASLQGQGLYEFQYNAVRVFEKGPANDEYSIIDVSDTQVSLGDLLEPKTLAKLDDFVAYVN